MIFTVTKCRLMVAINSFYDFFPDDDELFKDLARTYAGNHEYMHKGSGICHSDSFPEGKLLRLWSFQLK